MRAIVAVIVGIAACGRVSFDPNGASGTNDGSSDGGGGDDSGITTGCQAHPVQVINVTGTPYGLGILWTGSGYLAAWTDISVGGGPYPLYTRMLDRWGAPLAAPASITNITVFSCAASLSLAATSGGEYEVGYCDQRTSKLQVWMNHLLSDGTRIGGDGQVTNTTDDSTGARVTYAGTQLATAYRTATASGNDTWTNFSFVDPTTFAQMPPLRLTGTPSQSWSPGIASNGNDYAVAWAEGSSAIDYVVLDSTGQPITPVKSASVSTIESVAAPITAVGAGFAATTYDRSVVFDLTGTAIAMPTHQIDVVAIAASSTQLAAVGTDLGGGLQVLLEILDTATYAPTGAPLVVATGDPRAIVATPDGFGVAWVEANMAKVVTLCP